MRTLNYKWKSRRRFFLLMRSRTPPISSEFRGGGGFEHPKPPLSVRHWLGLHLIRRCVQRTEMLRHHCRHVQDYQATRYDFWKLFPRNDCAIDSRQHRYGAASCQSRITHSALTPHNAGHLRHAARWVGSRGTRQSMAVSLSHVTLIRRILARNIYI